MRLEIVTPEEYVGDILGDLNGRRGRIEGMEGRAGAQTVRGMVPLAEMFGYATTNPVALPGTRDLRHAFRPVRGSSLSLAEGIVLRGGGLDLTS